MKNKFLTFILIICMLGIIGGLAYFFIEYVQIDANNVLALVTSTNEVSNETIKPLEPTESSGEGTISGNLDVQSTNNNDKVISSTRYKYYYDQLDSIAKTIYSAVENNIENLKTGNAKIEFGEKFNSLLNEEGGNEKLNVAYQAALDAFCFHLLHLINY